MSADSFGAASALTVGDSTYRIFRMNAIDGACGVP
jgi:hypothetical protein